MSRIASTAFAALLLAFLAACSPAGSGAATGPAASGAASAPPCVSNPDPMASAEPGCLPPASTGATPAATPAFTTGPGGAPIGDWSLTLTGGPSAGTYGGRDEMTCVTLAGGPTSVAFNPVGSPPIGHADMGTDGSVDSILVSAGGLESGATYQASDADASGSAEVLQGPTVTDGILTVTVTGTQQFPGEATPRTMTLEVTCPLFPAETDG